MIKSFGPFIQFVMKKERKKEGRNSTTKNTHGLSIDIGTTEQNEQNKKQMI